MEVHALSHSAAPRGELAGERNAALAEKRRKSTEAQLARADQAKARAADRLAEVREAVARVIGANTRLSISRSESPFAFIYRAIDIDTGEIVHEWPQSRFIDLVRAVSEDVRADVEAGREIGSVFDRIA